MSSIGAPNISERIGLVRRNLGLTQREFASLVGCSYRAVQTWESGAVQPRPAAMRRLAELAEKPIAWFYEDGVAA